MTRVAFVLIAAVSLVAVPRGQSGDHWVATWTAAMIGRPPYPAAAAGQPAGAAQPARVPFPANQTLRQIVHTTLGGDRLRIVVSNAFGAAPLAIGAAHAALRDTQSAIVETSDRLLTFSGRATATLPPGAVMVSDAADVKVAPFSDVVVDLYLPGDATGQTLTIHRGAYQTNFLLGPGNHVGEVSFADATPVSSWMFLERVEVKAPSSRPAIVALGDSITDGTGSTPDTNARWPDVFARRLAEKGAKTAVVNAGIAGNRVLSDSIPEFGVNLLARFGRDVLAQPGATQVIIMEGINDIGNAREGAVPSADDLIAAHKQLIDRARTRGLKVFGATLTPFEGAAYYTDVGEQKRMAVNDWIRNGKAYDGVIDFDAATRDPQQPRRFLPQYDRGDHLHPNDAGYRAMANAINLSLFGAAR